MTGLLIRALCLATLLAAPATVRPLWAQSADDEFDDRPTAEVDFDTDELDTGVGAGGAEAQVDTEPANETPQADGDSPVAGEPQAAELQPVEDSPVMRSPSDRVEGAFPPIRDFRPGDDGGAGRSRFSRSPRGESEDRGEAGGLSRSGDRASAPQPTERVEGAPRAANGELVFNFAGADWRSVLEWFAEQADLSLQVNHYPTGTVTFTDTQRTYSVTQAMDQINRLLLDRGYTLVRRGRLLLLVDMEAENAAALISDLAEKVSPEALDERGESDIVRTVFPLGGLTPEAARSEIAQLIGPAGRVVVLDSARQVVVTDTAGRLKAIRTLLSNAETAGSEVTQITLKHRGADEVLEIARPLLGLDPGANSNDRIRIATGLFGDVLFATGEPATRAMLKSIVEKADTPVEIAAGGGQAETSAPTLEPYAVASVSPTMVIDVLQTLLAGMPDTRIAQDPQTGGIIAYAPPETHQLIRQTIDKLEGRGSTFEIIQLRRLEPSQALLTINKFFGITDANRKDAPTVDGDPVTGRLWVRGTPDQIELVKQLIDRLEGADAAGGFGDRVRVLPYTGRSAEETVEQLQQLWETIGRKNQIRMVSPASGRSASSNDTFPQRRVGGLNPTQPRRSVEPAESPAETPASAPDTEPREVPFNGSRYDDPQEALRRSNRDPSEDSTEHLRGGDSDITLVTQPLPADIESPFDQDRADSDTDNGAPGPDGTGDIVITMTPGGMIVASDDPTALSDFEQMMRTLNDQTANASAQPTVFWLKYAKAPEAAELVTQILGGGDSGGGGGGSLADAMLGELGGGMLGGLLGLGGGGDSASGPILTTTGSVSIVPDGRLNALIVQANPLDMRMVEMILEVVDREESPEDVRTTSKPQLIPVIYQSAADVATIVKAVYADRSGEQGGSRQQQQINPQDLINALRGGGSSSRGSRGGRGGGSQEATKPAPVNIAVDTRSNSLIVTAPPQDVEDIRELVEAIDAGGMQSEETVEIVTLAGSLKADVVQQALDSVLGTKTRTTESGRQQQAGSPSSPSDTSSSDDIQRRMEFFRQMRERSGSTGGSPFGGSSGFGGSTRGGSSFGGSTRGGSSFGGSTRGDTGSTRGSTRGSR